MAMDFTEDDTTIFDEDSFSEFSVTFSETARILSSAGGVMDTVSSVVATAVSTVDGCDFAGLFLVDGDDLTTPMLTDPVVTQIDDLQRSTGEGPCLDAVAQRLIFYADDLDREDRWPQFAEQARAAGIRSILALPLATDGNLGALNLYARYPAAFGVVDRAKSTLLASLASLALAAAHSTEDEARRSENFHAALSSRETIGEAMGILMERERISADEAFDVLRKGSQHLNLKLRQVAKNLVDTGESPDIGEPPEADESLDTGKSPDPGSVSTA